MAILLRSSSEASPKISTLKSSNNEEPPESALLSLPGPQFDTFPLSDPFPPPRSVAFTFLSAKLQGPFFCLYNLFPEPIFSLLFTSSTSLTF